jgi:dihydroneopterin aldolase
VPSPSPRATEIALAGMRFHVCVGILPHERELPQPLEVDLRVRLRAGTAEVTDYRTLHGLVATAVGAGPLRYLEDVASTVLEGALALPAVAWARVAVRKPHVPLPGPLAHAEIVMEGAHE